MSGKTLKVQMLGGFEVTYGDIPVVPKDARNSKMMQLFQYFLCNRSKMLSQDTLIGVLLGGEECGNPSSTLKNIVYRLRKLLMSVGLAKDCIVYKKSAYGFCNDVPCDIDIEKFSEIVGRLKDEEVESSKRLALCMEALGLYKGEFLRRTSSEPWVMYKAVLYQEQYVECVALACRLAKESGQLADMLGELNRAVTLYPYEEELAYLYISALHETKHVKEAIAQYEKTTTVLLNDLGVSPSEELRVLYNDITGTMQEVSQSVADIRSKLSETGMADGPFFSNLEVFANIYQFMVRHMERSGKSIFLMLCTLSEMDGSPPQGGERLGKITQAFHDAVKKACRRGDVYTRYSPSQFLLMLMEIQQENCDVVVTRLRQNFASMPRMNRTRLTCKYISAADMDQIMETSDLQLTWDVREKK